MSPLYIAVAFCIGSPMHPPSAAYHRDGTPLDAYQCDEGAYWDDGGVGGMPIEVCRNKLENIHDRGNIVKMCVIVGSGVSIDSLKVDWGGKN